MKHDTSRAIAGGDYQVLTGYLDGCDRRPGSEIEAWTTPVSSAARRHRCADPSNPATSANLGPLARATDYLRFGSRRIDDAARAELDTSGADGLGYHELGGPYSLAVRAAYLVALATMRRRGESYSAVERNLRAWCVLAALGSVHQAGAVGWRVPARVVLPMLRVGIGAGRSDLHGRERDIFAVSLRQRWDVVRPSMPRPRFAVAVGARSEWQTPDVEMLGRFIASPTPDGARELARLAGILGARIRPLVADPAEPQSRVEIVVERRGHDALAYLSGWHAIGPVLPPVVAMARTGSEVVTSTLYPPGWSFPRRGGTAGTVRVERTRSRLELHLTGARSGHGYPVIEARETFRFPRAEWWAVISPRGVEVHEGARA